MISPCFSCFIMGFIYFFLFRNYFSTKEVYIWPTFCHAVRDGLDKLSQVVEKGLALFLLTR